MAAAERRAGSRRARCAATGRFAAHAAAMGDIRKPDLIRPGYVNGNIAGTCGRRPVRVRTLAVRSADAYIALEDDLPASGCIDQDGLALP